MIKTLIVDDEPLAHKVLEAYCDKIDSIEVIGNCYDGMSTINFLGEHTVDLILLDIQMPDLTGLEILASLNHSPKIVFTTAYSEYAIEGYNFEEVIDYLLKPVSLPRFIKAINKVHKILRLEERACSQEHLSKETTSTIEYINLKDNGTLFRISVKDILYIQSWGNYVKLHLLDEDVKLFRITFKQLLTMLPDDQFTRIHKSYIVNTGHVVSVKKNQLYLKEELLPIGKSYSMLIKEALK